MLSMVLNTPLDFRFQMSGTKVKEHIHFLQMQILKALSANSTKWSNTLKQFVCICRRIVWVCLIILWGWLLTLSWRRPLLYRNQSIDLLCKFAPISELFWSVFSRIRTRIIPNTDIFYALTIKGILKINHILAFLQSHLSGYKLYWKQDKKRTIINNY